MTKELEHFLAPFSTEIIEVAQALRSMLLEEAAGATELVYDAYNAVALGYSFTERLSEAFCHIAVYSHWVNLGFNRGAELLDVEGDLAGSGKRIRHLRMQTLGDIERPTVRKLVRQAIAIAELDTSRVARPGGSTPPRLCEKCTAAPSSGSARLGLLPRDSGRSPTPG